MLPADVVVIIAAKEGEEDKANAPEEGELRVNCRDCGVALIASARTTRLALANPARDGRPLGYYCWACLDQYRIPGSTEFHDHRKGHQ